MKSGTKIAIVVAICFCVVAMSVGGYYAYTSQDKKDEPGASTVDAEATTPEADPSADLAAGDDPAATSRAPVGVVHLCVRPSPRCSVGGCAGPPGHTGCVRPWR